MRSLALWSPGDRFSVPPFPTGWFAVAFSDDVARGAVVPVDAFGGKLVLYRGQDGAPRLFEAFCPHLGAHLGHGSCVEGDTLRCGFHAWRFDGGGRCVEIPYAKRVPAAARVRAFPVREENGLVLAWFDAHGAAPHWEPEAIPACADASWERTGRRSFEIRGHIQDLGENVADSAHFQFVHGMPAPPEITASAAEHVLSTRAVFQYPETMGGMGGTLEGRLWGLGLSAQHFRGLVETLVVSATTPIDVERVVLRASLWVRRLDGDLTGMVAEAFAAEVYRQIQHDIPFWEHKIMPARPVLCDGDGPIGSYRRWARRFFPGVALADAG
jgi:nitrite reductase/ring-hydroxylating ferredoxin subunit